MHCIRRVRPFYRFLINSRNNYCKSSSSPAAEEHADIDKKQEVAGLEYFKELSSTLHGDSKSKKQVSLLDKSSSNFKDSPQLNSMSVTQEILGQRELEENDKSVIISEPNSAYDPVVTKSSTTVNVDSETSLNLLPEKVKNIDLVSQTSNVVTDTIRTQRVNLSDVDESNLDLDEKKEDSTIKIHTKYEVPGLKLQPKYNLAAFVNQSETLQQFLKLGVEVARWDKLDGIPEFILKSDFERDIKPYINFLVDNGVPADALSYFFTKNPFIFQEDFDNLQSRIEYFTSKNFTPEAIGRIIAKAPFVLNLKIATLDGKLGYFQHQFKLTGNDVRKVITRQPKLVTYDFNKIKHSQFTMAEEFGFSPSELKTMILSKPKLWLASRAALQIRFQYIHNTMGLTHEQISQFPEALLNRHFRTKQRHLYLQKINRAQYDPTMENYISLKAIVSSNDVEFCRKVAKTSVLEFNEFLKTL